jgi:hypothetical protein
MLQRTEKMHNCAVLYAISFKDNFYYFLQSVPVAYMTCEGTLAVYEIWGFHGDENEDVDQHLLH